MTVLIMLLCVRGMPGHGHFICSNHFWIYKVRMNSHGRMWSCSCSCSCSCMSAAGCHVHFIASMV